jgi:hypothetical protein
VLSAGACSLFDEQDAALMEWVEDVRLWEVQGYGDALNYQIAAPLLADMIRSLTVRGWRRLPVGEGVAAAASG